MIAPLLTSSLLLLAHVPNDPAKGQDRDRILPGRLIQGPAIEKASLDGRVVLFVQWGVTGTFQDLCLPLLQLAKEFGPENFQMILSLDHPEPGAKLLDKMGLSKAPWIARRVSVTSRGRVIGRNLSGSLPFFALYDHEGGLIDTYSGGTSVTAELRKINRAILSHVERIPPIYLGKEPFVETTELANNISAGKDLGENLRELERQIRVESLKTGGKGPKSLELRRIMEAVRRHVNTQILVTWDLRVAEPDKGMRKLRKLELDLRGTRLHSRVKMALSDARVDPVFTRGLRYLRILDGIRMRLRRLRMCKFAKEIPNFKLRTFDPACPDCRWGQEGHIRDLENDLGRLQESYKTREIRWRAMSLESAFLAGRKHPISHETRLQLIQEEKDRTLAEQKDKASKMRKDSRWSSGTRSGATPSKGPDASPSNSPGSGSYIRDH